jgi:hypothetical protein
MGVFYHEDTKHTKNNLAFSHSAFVSFVVIEFNGQQKKAPQRTPIIKSLMEAV